jgi:ribosomal protein S7
MVVNSGPKNKVTKIIFFRSRVSFFSRSLLLQKFINILTKGGKKRKVENIVINYLSFIKSIQPIFINPVFLFFNILETIKPNLGVVVKRIGKNLYRIPIPMRLFMQYTKALR